MIILTILGFLLSLILKVVILSIRLGMNLAVATVSAAAMAAEKAAAKTSKKPNKNTQRAVRWARRALVGTLTMISRAVDFLLSLVMLGWAGAIAAVVILLLTVGGGWLVLTQLSDGPTTSLVQTIVNQPQAAPPPDTGTPGGTGTVDLTGKSIPAVAASPAQLPGAMLSNSAWAMINRPSGCYIYQQGNTDSCHYDCSTWTAALMEMAGWTISSNGKTIVPAKGPRYIITKNRKSDLNNYFTTSMMKSSWNMPGVNKGRAKSLSDYKPGDIIWRPGHVAMYVGVNSKGEHVISHAGHRGAKTYSDMDMTKFAGDVGFASMYDPTGWTIYRLSDYTG